MKDYKVFRPQRNTPNLYSFFVWCFTYRSNDGKNAKNLGR